MTANNLLSICIPTCNRVDSLKELIPDLIAKVKKYNIAIYISDNNSIDSTKDYIVSKMKDYELLYYHKVDISDYKGAEVTISAEKNIKEALNLPTTTYSLLLGDHYILYDESSIEYILSHLIEDSYDAIVLHHNGRVLSRNEDYIYTEKNQFIEEMGWYITMLSTFICSKNMIEKLQLEKYYNSNFAHSMAILDYVGMYDFKIKYINEVTTWTTKGGIKGLSSWHSKAIEIFTKYWYKGIMSLPDSYSYESKIQCIRNHAIYNPKFYSFNSLIFYRFTNAINMKVLFSYRKYILIIVPKSVFISMLFLTLIPKRSIKYLFKDSYAYIKRIVGNIDTYSGKL